MCLIFLLAFGACSERKPAEPEEGSQEYEETVATPDNTSADQAPSADESDSSAADLAPGLEPGLPPGPPLAPPIPPPPVPVPVPVPV